PLKRRPVGFRSMTGLEGGSLSLPALLGRVFLLRAGQLLGMDDGLVDRTAGGPEIGKLGIEAVALQDIDRRERLAADLVGGGALDDRPVDAAGPGLLVDILETAVDNRVCRIELALDFPVGRAAATSRRAATPTVALIAASIRSRGAV